MSRLAAELDAINLSQGFPDFDCDPALVDAVAAHMRSGKNQYAPMQGVLRLREAIAAKYEWFCGRRYDPETEVTVTSGGTEGIFDAVAATVGPGDEVVVLEPCYDSYVPAIALSGGTPVFVPLQFPDYTIDWDAVRPRRHAADADDHAQLASQSRRERAHAATTCARSSTLVEGTRILILSDEVYEHIIFDGLRHESCARYDELAARSVRHRFVRQDLSHDRVEGGLHRRARRR